jgi:chromosome segregation ATPase
MSEPVEKYVICPGPDCRHDSHSVTAPDELDLAQSQVRHLERELVQEKDRTARAEEQLAEERERTATVEQELVEATRQVNDFALRLDDSQKERAQFAAAVLASGNDLAQAQAQLKQARDLLDWLDARGGLGLDVHERIEAVIGKREWVRR